MIDIHQVSKSYQADKKKVIALKDISCKVEQGELFGLIGPDGAGKTSLIRIIATLLLADTGSIRVDGIDVVAGYKKIRQSIGYMPGKFSLYLDLSVEENLHFFATIFKTTIKENYRLIEDIYTQIEPFKKRRAGALSGGMKQKLALCCALIHKPSVLLLDEPTTGVDVVSRKEFWQMLQRLKAEGLTILVATPYMDEAILCDRVALMQDGRILDIDSPQHLISKHQHPLWAIKSNNMYALLHELRQAASVETVYPFGEFYHVTPRQGMEDPDDLVSQLKNTGHADIQYKKITPNIEDIFMDLMKKNADVASQ